MLAKYRGLEDTSDLPLLRRTHDHHGLMIRLFLRRKECIRRTFSSIEINSRRSPSFYAEEGLKRRYYYVLDTRGIVLDTREFSTIVNAYYP